MKNLRNIFSYNFIANSIFLLLIIFFVLSLSLTSFQKKKGGAEEVDSNTIAHINGEAISKDELEFFIKKHRASVYSYFIRSYNLKSDEFKWADVFGNEIPAEVLKEKALNAAIETKVQQILMKQKGILEDVGYAAFLLELQRVNATRKQAKENNEILYGPIEFNENSYFDYSFSNKLIKLKESLEGKEIEFHEQEAKVLYEELKNDLFIEKDGTCYPYEKALPYLKKKLLDIHYEAMVRELIESASITIYTNNYELIKPN